MRPSGDLCPLSGITKPVAVVLAVAALLSAGCSSDPEEKVVHKPSDNTRAHYQVIFPSAAVAATTETMQLFVFDATNEQKDFTDCLSLVTKRKSSADLPAAPLKLSETEATPCELFETTAAGDAKQPIAGKKGTVELTYGSRTFLVVAKRSKQDYFIGCSKANLSTAETTVEISLTPASAAIAVPTTTCTTLSDRCANRCQ